MLKLANDALPGRCVDHRAQRWPAQRDRRCIGDTEPGKVRLHTRRVRMSDLESRKRAARIGQVERRTALWPTPFNERRNSAVEQRRAVDGHRDQPFALAASHGPDIAHRRKHGSGPREQIVRAIEAWAKATAAGGRPFTRTYQAATFVGEGVVRSTGQLQQMTRLVVVLRRVQQQNRFFFILTSYPVP